MANGTCFSCSGRDVSQPETQLKGNPPPFLILKNTAFFNTENIIQQVCKYPEE